MKYAIFLILSACFLLGSDKFDCSKKYCKEMKSCKEAYHYLKTCGRGDFDRDGDGVPCEKQLCGRNGHKFSGFSSARDEKSEVSNLKGAADSCGAEKFNGSVIAIKFAS